MSEDDNSGLTRRRVLGGIATVGAASAAAGAGTMAYFSDEEGSENNTVQAGTLNLGFDGTANDQVSMSELAPGQEVKGAWTLVNNGSINGDHVEVEASYDQNDGGSNFEDTGDKTAKEVAQRLEISTLEYGGNSINPTQEISDVDDDGISTLHDLMLNGLDDLTPPPSGGNSNFKIGFTLDPDVGNAFQNEGVDITFTFTLNQDGSQ